MIVYICGVLTNPLPLLSELSKYFKLEYCGRESLQSGSGDSHISTVTCTMAPLGRQILTHISGIFYQANASILHLNFFFLARIIQLQQIGFINFIHIIISKYLYLWGPGVPSPSKSVVTHII